MGIRFPLRSQSKSPEQYAKENRPDLFFDQLRDELPQNPPTETVEAAPVSSDEYGDLGGNVDESQSPDYVGNPIDIYGDVPPSQSGVMPDQSVPPSPFGDEPETDKPETKTPAKPSSEPGRTAALETAQAQQPEDEYEKLFKEYGKAQEEYRAGSEALSKESEAANRQQILMTGVAGALQSFGEGLAAITGGSAKPIQTAAESVRRMGEAGAAEREGKAKTLKERLMMARQPLEAKAEQDKFRTVFEDRQRKQRLVDPMSKESESARAVANQTIDTLSASFRSAGNSQTADELQRTKEFVKTANAQQLTELFDRLQKLGVKPAISAEQKQQQEMQKIERKGELQSKLAADKESFQLTRASAKTDTARAEQAIKDYRKVTEVINKDIAEAKSLGDRMDNFLNLLDKASNPKLMADEKTRTQINDAIAAEQGILNYLNARKFESKGVFTDQDLDVLSQLRGGGTWADQFSNWLSKGIYNQQTARQISKMQAILNSRRQDFKNPGVAVAKGYASTWRDMANELRSMSDDNQGSRKYDSIANTLEQKYGQGAEEQNKSQSPNTPNLSPAAAPTVAPTPMSKPGDDILTGDEIVKRFTKGTLKSGDIVNTKEGRKKVVNVNGQLQLQKVENE